jgi:hypothetical protein
MTVDYFQQAFALSRELLGDDHEQTEYLRNRLFQCRYYQAIAKETIQQFLPQCAFTITVDDGDNPARQQGLTGEYYLLEYADWTQDSPSSLFDINVKWQGRPKTIVIMKDSVITRHHFQNRIGVHLHVKEVNFAEKQRISQLYEEWKKHKTTVTTGTPVTSMEEETRKTDSNGCFSFSFPVLLTKELIAQMLNE